MSRLQSLKLFVHQRLNAAVEEIFGHFERTITEYEEELDRRHQSQLDVVLRREIKLRRDVQQLLVSTEEVSPEQAGWSSSVDQEDADHRLIKEEIHDLWSSEGGEAEPLAERLASFVKSENAEPTQSSTLRRGQSEPGGNTADASGSVAAADISLRSANDDRTSDEPETDVSEDERKEAREPPSGFSEVRPARDVKSGAGKKFFVCGECGRKFGRKDSLRRHMRYHTGERPYSCSVCGKRFSQRPNLIRHMRCHSGEKPFRCSFCDTSFSVRSALVNHMRIHTGEKPYSCLNCDKSFTQRGGLKKHMTVHTGEKPYICTICNKSFSQKANLTYHFSVHTGLKQFSCSVCDKRFTWQSQVKSHKCVGETSSNSLS